MCVNAGFIASDWAWLHGPVLGHRGRGLGCGDRWAWQEVKGEAMSVNEALYGGAIEGPIRLDGS